MSKLENRIPPPIVTLLVAAAMWGGSFAAPPFTTNSALHYGLVALLFVLAGLFGFPAVRAFIRAKTTIDPVRIDRASTIVTTGAFSVTRNPMYVAMTLLLLSWAAYLATAWSLLGPVLFVLFITRFQIIPEERAMAAKFGAAYLAYKGRVHRWI